MRRPARRPRPSAARPAAALEKAPTGIAGLDAITEGGLPRGRPTLICGGAGSGKTLLALEFLVRGAREHGEPGVLVAFEETAEELEANARSLGFDLGALVRKKQLVVDYVHVDRTEILETGSYSLEGLFVRLAHAIDAVGAKRVAVDSLETLFSGLADTSTLRSELRRLFRWLKGRGLTAVVTAEVGDGRLTRHGLEEYVSDCVVFLDHRVNDRFATRRLRVVKYRGSRHVTDECAFVIGGRGLSVMPIAALGLDHVALEERIPTGVPGLDAMLGGAGYYQGGSVLVSGTPGTGKTSLGAHLMEATCRRGERCIAFLFEESPSQLLRNMRSIGVDLAPWIEKGLLLLRSTRPTSHGMESHLVEMQRLVEEFGPKVVVVDPISNLAAVGTAFDARSLLTRLTDFLKTRQITALFTSLAHVGLGEEATDMGISSLMDTWLLVRDLESNGERNRVLYVLKSRGMAHSNQVREFKMTSRGIVLVEPYVGPGGVLTGTARLAQEAREAAEARVRRQDFETRKLDLRRRRESLLAQIIGLRDELEVVEEARSRTAQDEQVRQEMQDENRELMARARQATPGAGGRPAKPPRSERRRRHARS